MDFRKDRKENRKNGFCGLLVGEMRWRKTSKTLNVLSKGPQKINSFNLVRFIITITIGQGILSLECFTFFFCFIWTSIFIETEKDYRLPCRTNKHKGNRQIVIIKIKTFEGGKRQSCCLGHLIKFTFNPRKGKATKRFSLILNAYIVIPSPPTPIAKIQSQTKRISSKPNK